MWLMLVYAGIMSVAVCARPLMGYDGRVRNYRHRGGYQPELPVRQMMRHRPSAPIPPIRHSANFRNDLSRSLYNYELLGAARQTSSQDKIDLLGDIVNFDKALRANPIKVCLS